MRFSNSLLTLCLFIGTAAAAQDTSPNMPMRPGDQARPANWNSDGVPKPPHMWKGHGENWRQHYKACSNRYGSRYNVRTDMVMQNGRRTRCAL